VAKKEAEHRAQGADALGPSTRELDDALARVVLEGDAILKLSGASSCGDACRALASMERAARTVCDLVSPEERGRCDDAAARLRAARRRVRDACGTCANGPTTDPDAPLR